MICRRWLANPNQGCVLFRVFYVGWIDNYTWLCVQTIILTIWEGKCHQEKKNSLAWPLITFASQLWYWNLTQQSTRFTFANWTKQFLFRLNGQKLYLQLKLPTLGPHTLYKVGIPRTNISKSHTTCTYWIHRCAPCEHTRVDLRSPITKKPKPHTLATYDVQIMCSLVRWVHMILQ